MTNDGSGCYHRVTGIGRYAAPPPFTARFQGGSSCRLSIPRKMCRGIIGGGGGGAIKECTYQQEEKEEKQGEKNEEEEKDATFAVVVMTPQSTPKGLLGCHKNKSTGDKAH